MDMKELHRKTRTEQSRLAKPPDLKDLIRRGILKKAGAWYEILKPDALPQYVLAHAHAVETSRKGPARLQFMKPRTRTAAKSPAHA